MPWEQPAHLVPNLLEKGKKKARAGSPGGDGLRWWWGSGSFISIFPLPSSKSHRGSPVLQHLSLGDLGEQALRTPSAFLRGGGGGGGGKPSSSQAWGGLREKARIWDVPTPGGGRGHANMSIFDRIWPQKGQRGERRGVDFVSTGASRAGNGELGSARYRPENPGEKKGLITARKREKKRAEGARGGGGGHSAPRTTPGGGGGSSAPRSIPGSPARRRHRPALPKGDFYFFFFLVGKSALEISNIPSLRWRQRGCLGFLGFFFVVWFCGVFFGFFFFFPQEMPF